MKKFFALFLALMMMVSVTAFGEAIASPDAGAIEDAIASPDAGVIEEIKLGQALVAPHGTKCFAVITVALQGDVIVAAHIEEFQFMANTSIGVPNSDQAFGQNFPEGMVLASKRQNNEAYSANMANAGSTVALLDNYTAIENYVVGMTVAELEAELAGYGEDKAAAMDAVSGATLTDTLGYLQGILAAAKNAQ